MQFRTGAIGFAALLTALDGAPAQADVLLNARLSNFGYDLIDLDPNDGIAPALEVLTAPYAVSVGGRSGVIPLPPRPRVVLLPGAGAGQSGQLDGATPVFESVVRTDFSARAGLSGSLADHGFGTFITGRARGSRDEPYLVSYAEVQSEMRNLVVRLTPMTRVLWSGDLTLSMENTLTRRGRRLEAGELDAGVTAGDTGMTRGESFNRNLRIHATAGTQRLRETHAVQVGYSNPDDDFALSALILSFTGTARAFEPIPEPGTGALLLGGLALLGGAVRARRRGAA